MMCRAPTLPNYRNMRRDSGEAVGEAAVTTEIPDRRTPVDELAYLRKEVTELRQALETRTVIGQAVGMLMERYKVSADAAFSVLTRVSRQTNVKVREVAAAMTADVTAPAAAPERLLGDTTL